MIFLQEHLPANRENKMDKTLLKDILNAVEGRRDNIINELTDLVASDSTLGNEQHAQSIIKETFIGLGTNVEEVSIDLDKLASLHWVFTSCDL
ncbi:hypothetical protein [Psychromonas sp. KJ10-2]|uniref:hypothetical protein n=1 Tax=Psychromonas sp. KJ10-2 TaxID=3391822 RepID=UPI0039B4BFE7